MSFEYDPFAHRYLLDGDELPSVTRLIRPLFGNTYSEIDPDILQRAADRGTRIHRYTETEDAGVPVRLCPGDPDTGYMEAYRRFRADVPFRVLDAEVAGFHPILHYAGTADRIVRLPDGGHAILDYKTTRELMPQAAIQTLAYALIFGCERRFAVQLRPEGRYTLHEYRYWEDDETTFRACLTAVTAIPETPAYERAWTCIRAWKERHHVPG